jgi:hypothetical protein
MLDLIRRTLDECLLLLDYGNICASWLFGLPSENLPTRASLWEKLLGWREQFDQAVNSKGDALLIEPARFLRGLLSIKEMCERDRETWKNGPIRILCTDDELRSIAQRVKERGIVKFSKSEFDRHFDLSIADPFWCHVPDYTRVYIGQGLGMSSPEHDMYYAMCQSYDRAIRSSQEFETARQRLVTEAAVQNNFSN